MKKLTGTILVLFSLLSAMPGFSQVDDGYPLPFLEQWNSGTFGTNNWQPEAENWSINGNEGISSPCAEFTWDPIQNDYSISLESDQFQADYMTEGLIYLDFDIKLDDFSGDGLEHMKVQVWNWNNQVWTTVSTYSNDDGDFDWASEHLDITNLAKGKVFKIRFIAQGENSLHIVSWFIDNIHLYRECEGVNDLTAECDTNLNIVVLHWPEPGSGNSDEWIHWDDEINYTAIGIGSPMPFDLAARWEPEQLSGFEGSSITQIAFFPNEESSTYRVRVWIGELAENLIVDQEVISPVIGEWNTITLETPVPVDITQELWIGYQNDGENGYQMGVDDGPAIDGYGNMINFGGWQTLLEINPAMDYNWNIAAHLVTVTGESKLLNKGSRELIGYNVYRSIDGGGYFLLDFISGYVYTDQEEFIIGTLYCFMVTAVYQSETDQCESNISNEACVVCGTFVPEEKSQIELNVYPNPASEVLFIESPEKIESMSIFDCRGITIEQLSNRTVEQTNRRTDEQARDHILKIPLNGLAPGLYLVRVETFGGVSAGKVVVK